MPAPVDYEVRVTLTIAIPRRYPFPMSLRGELDLVLRGLATISEDILPRGTHLHGNIGISVRTAKEIVADAKREIARRKREGR